MKKLLTAAAAVMMMVALTACSNNNGDKQVLVKTSAGNITKGDLYKEMKTSVGKQVMQKMVYEKILEKKYDVSKQVDKKVKQLKSQYKGQFKQWLQSQGMANESQLRDQLKLQFLVQKAQQAGVKVTDKEMKSYYDKNKDKDFAKIKVSHILVKTKAKAVSIEKKLHSGSDFASLAKKYSTDPGSKKKGGDLGYIPVNSQNYDPTFMAAAKKLKTGQVSDPVQTQFGWHIIKVTGKKVQPYKDVKSQIKKTLTTQKQKSMPKVINELNKEGKIKVEDKFFKGEFKNQPLNKNGSSSNSSGSNSSSSGQ